MALILPVFLLVFMAIIDLGRVLHVYTAIHHQCIEAARVASRRLNLRAYTSWYSSTTHTPLPEVQATFRKYASPLAPRTEFQTKGETPGVVYATLTNVGNNQTFVKVEAYTHVTPITPLVARFFGNRRTLRVSAESFQDKE